MESKNSSNDQSLTYVELTYYADTMPQIKSYYAMTQTEYQNLNLLYLDLYIENFINDEELTKDKLDIHTITNPESINVCRTFLNNFNNPFDIILLIREKINASCANKHIFHKYPVFNNLSVDSDFSNADEKHIANNDIVLNSSTQTSSNADSDEDINTITEIIDTYNKSKTNGKNKLINLSNANPKLLNDPILNEIIDN